MLRFGLSPPAQSHPSSGLSSREQRTTSRCRRAERNSTERGTLLPGDGLRFNGTRPAKDMAKPSRRGASKALKRQSRNPLIARRATLGHRYPIKALQHTRIVGCAWPKLLARTEASTVMVSGGTRMGGQPSKYARPAARPCEKVMHRLQASVPVCARLPGGIPHAPARTRTTCPHFGRQVGSVSTRWGQFS